LPVGARGVGIDEDLASGRRDPGAPHDGLGDGLAPLEAGRAGRRAENPETRLLESIDQPLDERRLRTDHREIGPLFARKCRHRVDVVGADRDALGQAGHARVPRRRPDLLDQRRLGDLPGERVLAPAAAHDEDLQLGTLLHFRFARPPGRVRA
jgi:hypothetical protein